MRIFLVFILCFISFISNGQYIQENFENPYDYDRNHFIIDTVNYHNNIWQIGKPYKIVFDSALSYPNAIVTDTLHPYPKNDTSVFTILYRLSGYPELILSFYYKLDIDSGTIAKFEVSGDSGKNWINPFIDDTTYKFFWGSTKPSLDTSVHTWTRFDLDINDWLYAHPGGPDSFPLYRTSDTLLFRFTFISDSDTISKDGWMMDNFLLQIPFHEGYTSILNLDNKLHIYPNPSSGDFIVHSDISGNNAIISIYDIVGHEVFRKEQVSTDSYLNTGLPPGFYILRYISDKGALTKRFVIK